MKARAEFQHRGGTPLSPEAHQATASLANILETRRVGLMDVNGLVASLMIDAFQAGLLAAKNIDPTKLKFIEEKPADFREEVVYGLAIYNAHTALQKEAANLKSIAADMREIALDLRKDGRAV